MPKIPTFTTEARPTAEVGSIRSNIQIDPTKTMAAGLSDIAGVAQDYYIKQRDNVEKLEAKKKFYEMKSEENKILEKLKNNPNEFESVDIYNNEFGTYKNNQIEGIQNRRIKKKVEEFFDLDQPETIYKIKKNSFDVYEKQENEIYNTDQNIFASEYSLESDEKLKELNKQKRINSAKEYESKMMKGKEWLSKELKKIETDSVIFDVDKAITKNDFATALNILKSADKSKIDSEELQKKLLQIEKQKETFAENNFNQNINQIASNSQFSNLGKISDIAIPSTGNASTDYKNKAKVKSVIEKVQQTIDKDGSAEFYTNNDRNLYQLNSTFNQIYAGTMQNPTPENISAAADAFDEYAVEANKKYNELSVPQEKRTLLTAASIENLKQRIQGATGTEDKLKVINEIQLIYGKNIPSIMNQIKNKIGDSVAFSMSVTDPDLKKYSLEGVITDENKKNFSSKLKNTMASPEVEISKTIRKQLESFSNIIANQPRSKVNAAAVIDPVVSNLTTAVMRRVIDGTESLSSSDVTKIAKDFTEKFSSDYDLTNDTYWIPRKIGNEFVNQLFFEARSEVFKTSLKYDQIDFSQIKIKPIGDGEKLLSQKETLEFFKKNGEFYLNSNDEVYFGVKDNDGVPRKFMYSTISENGKETYKPLTFKFLDNSVNVGGFHDLDMELIYNYMVISDPNIPTEAMLP
jgi:hypothetical protein